MKIVKASEYKVVEQLAKSPAHISLLALLLGLEPHREALLRVLTAAQVLKETPPDRIEETIGSIFSNTISFSDDELSSEGWSHSRALHIVCKCNNYIIGRVMIDNGSALNVCLVTTLRQMNVDLNRVRPSKTATRAFDGSRREVNGEIDLLIDVGPCSLLLGRPWIHSAGAVPSSLHQRLKFIVEEKLITVKGEEDYAIYKETAVSYISVGDDENLPFHSFETISVIRDYEESGPSRADRMVGKVLLRNNYIPGTGLGARGQGNSHPIEIEEYKHRRGLGFRPSCHEIIEARRGNHLHHLAAYYGKLNRGIPFPLLSRFFPGPSHTIGGTLDGPSSDSDDTLATPSAVTEEIPSRVHIRLAQENEELDNWTSVPCYSAVIAMSVDIGTTRVEPAPHFVPHSAPTVLKVHAGARRRVNAYGKGNILLEQEVHRRGIQSLEWVMQRLRQYTLYHTVHLLSKADPLRYLLDSPSSMKNIAKWRCQLTEYDIEYVPRTSVKGQAIADHLAEFPIDDDTPINTDIPDEGVLQVDEEKKELTWKMYFDGAVNSVGSGVGAVLISPDGRHYPVAAKVDFSCTNNVAEYEACILNLQAAIDFKDRHEMLPYALLAYRTSIRTSTGATSYSLVYGMEVVLPIEVEIPSMRILAEAELAEAEWAKQRYEQLNLIDEKRLKALCHGQCYQQRMARAFNAKVRPRDFSPGAIETPGGIFSLTDSRLPHATGCDLNAPETVEGCTTPPKSTMFKEGQAIKDHHQSPRMKRSRFERQSSRVTQRFA
ncbi:hypothetical protein CRG98_000668 [Punica granatum]|uniref:G-patch domain-containing protein n=1 Tax=Punica granatum TaxID=22663 RepID=A0A2I0LE24_PUNGR|nr:hypothetical protein CRG98_000668 [Punica granatum]